jgi:hypothetical protein
MATTSIDHDMRMNVMRAVQSRIKSMVDAKRSLEEVESWLARQSLTELEEDLGFIVARHDLSRHSVAVERYLASIEAGIGA